MLDRLPLTALLLPLLLTACGPDETAPADNPTFRQEDGKRFTLMLDASIDFRNDLTYTEALNPYTYRNFYNGGGVGIGDFDGDGRQDVFLTGNLVPNRLYLNRGNWRFEDVTAAAGVGSPDSWSTGVAVVDIDGDGDQDLYVCKAGPPAGEEIPGMTGVRHNELFLNDGTGFFTEAAADFGLDVVGLSVHAAFFDYDGDGDLDCYLLNNSTRSTTGYDLKRGLREVPDPDGGNKLLRNDAGRFVDASAGAGIYTSAIGFGLGVTVGDVNGDYRPDLYVSNDFFERDYLYLNRGDGTFDEALEDYLPEISLGSMGADLADLTGDGLPELFVTEMLPGEERRRKTKAAFNGWNRYQLFRDEGYHQQFSRNVLQLNRGGGRFSEIGRLAGVAATDWSWGALLFDMDGDGRRDIFVANGSGKDLIDQDYINFNGNPAAIRRMLFEEGKGITEIIDQIPEEKLVNGVFRNRGDLSFRPVAEEWGLDQATFSNGAAYGDLDGDGDWDLVVNNINDRAGIYRNNSAERGRTVRLRSTEPGNPDAIGALVVADGAYTEIYPMRGFQSTVSKAVLVGPDVDSVLVRWPGGAWERFGVARLIEEGRGDAAVAPQMATTDETLLVQRELGVGHAEDRATEFDRDPLLPLGINNEGPALAVGKDFVFRGGAAGSPSLLLDRRTLQALNTPIEDHAGEAVDAVFFDADGDGDEDLYVVYGSHQFGAASSALRDRLYLNNGGSLRATDAVLPSASRFHAGSCVRAQDVDRDGDTDLFVGGRARPGLYGVPTDSYLLLNDGRGAFTSMVIENLGMVTDAVWLDHDTLAVACEWGRIEMLTVHPGEVVRLGAVAGAGGLWSAMASADLNGNGRQELIVGNHGKNSLLGGKLQLFVNDFDGNGRAEQLLVRDGKPLALWSDLVKQIPALRKRINTYAEYAELSVTDLFAPGVLARSTVHDVDELQSLVLMRTDTGWTSLPLPVEAQFAPIHAIAVSDLNDDGVPDLMTGGNQTVGRPELGIYAADFGNVLIGNGDGTFTALPQAATGLALTGDVRAIQPLGPARWLVARSNDKLIELKKAN